MPAREIIGLLTGIPLCIVGLFFWLAVLCAPEAEASTLDNIITAGRDSGRVLIGGSLFLIVLLILEPFRDRR